MFRSVTIIALLVSSTYAFAMPRRYQPPQRSQSPKCEKILVSESVQEQVQEMAVTVAELVGEMKLKLILKNSPDSNLVFAASDEEIAQLGSRLAQMYALVEQIWKNFSVSASQVERDIEVLKLMIDEYVPKIKAGLASMTVVISTPPSQRRNFMKRHIFGAGGPLAEMGDWDASEIEAYLRGGTPSSEPPKVAPQPPPPPLPNYDFPMPGWRGGYTDWPPREKP